MPSLRSVTLGDYSFCASIVTSMESMTWVVGCDTDLPSLVSVLVGSHSLEGIDNENCELVIRGPDSQTTRL